MKTKKFQKNLKTKFSQKNCPEVGSPRSLIKTQISVSDTQPPPNMLTASGPLSLRPWKKIWYAESTFLPTLWKAGLIFKKKWPLFLNFTPDRRPGSYQKISNPLWFEIELKEKEVAKKSFVALKAIEKILIWIRRKEKATLSEPPKRYSARKTKNKR